MNQEDIVQWTREAGGFDATPEFLARFAALVAKAERERLADQIDRMPFGDTAASFSIWIREQSKPAWDWPGRTLL